MTEQPFTTAKFAVLWDLDGVICDSGELHYEAWVKAFGEHHISFDHAAFERSFGMNNTGVIRDMLGDPPQELIDQIDRRKEILYRESIPGHLEALPGVRIWLERLYKRGIPMAIASSGPMENISLTLETLELRPYFTAIVSVAGRAGKPDPLVFLEAAQALNMPTERCIVVEDAIAGIEAAHRAGMKCIAVTTTNPAEKLKGADIVIGRLDQLPAEAFDKLSS